MTYEALRSHLLSLETTLSLEEAQRQVPNTHGIYSIHATQLDSLPAALQRHQRSVATVPHVIYIGRARGSKGLHRRLVQQDLLHKGHSTFSRSLGAVLSYLPPAGQLIGKANQQNYKFSKQDAAEIIQWVRDNLRVCFVELETERIDSVEAQLIDELRPCFNITGNLTPCGYVSMRRSTCRSVARGETTPEK